MKCFRTNKAMKDYIDKVVEAVLKGEPFRKLVLKELASRISAKLSMISEKVIESKTKYGKEKDWWREYLILKNPDKRTLVWFGGSNEKTIRNTLGYSDIETCRQFCKENYELLREHFTALPESFPKVIITLQAPKQVIELTDFESFLFIHAVMAMAKAMTGGIWSEVGKKAGRAILEKIFSSLGIPKGPFSPDFYYEIEEGKVRGEREIDAKVYYKGHLKHTIEIKLLGIGNPEIGNEAIARGCDIFLVDDLTDMMIKQAKKRGITVIFLKEAIQRLYEIFKQEGLPVKKPET